MAVPGAAVLQGVVIGDDTVDVGGVKKYLDKATLTMNRESKCVSSPAFRASPSLAQ